MRYVCNDCKKKFSVMMGTIFEASKLPLPDWFMLIFMMINAKRGISAKYLFRAFGSASYKTAWYCCMRIRCAMIENCNLLQNTVEMDETYLSSKKGKTSDNIASLSVISNKRGRGTNKTPVVGIVERNGKVVLQVMEKLTSRNLMAMLRQNVDTENSTVVTDEFRSYHKFDEIVEHLTVSHSKGEYVRGKAHTNTIEGFFSILKNSIKGNHIAISKKYLPFYLVNSAYIYNHRKYKTGLFEAFMKDAVDHQKCLINYKPEKSPRALTKPKCEQSEKIN